MKFLLGLLVGAMVVLGAAQGLRGADWQARLLRLLDDLGADARDARDTLTLPVPARAEPQPAAAAPAEVLPSGEEPARLPIPRPPDPQPLQPSVAEAPREDVQEIVNRIFGAAPGIASNDAAVEDLAEDLDENLAEDPAEELAADVAAAQVRPPPTTLTGNSQTVWVPFHSERSADGFAERLTESVGHPFEVERHGPGRYQVVFAYGDDADRRDLLARAAEVTGLPL